MVLSEVNDKLARYLIISDIPRSVAYTLVYIRDKGEVTSVEIERETGLRQPEVSIAMQWLRRKGWINKRNMKKEGKGRPVHGYRLSKEFNEILDEIIGELANKISEINENIEQLKTFRD
ncbi:MAG: ArsR family transcriptional regulator [Thermoplasmatales archaeon A-plasma]|jgi:predicted transcriptional regulator|nr:MAG: ArsR family transcriptional regulator [Thermoplasmatales archaeon A-plasma]MCL5732679.1 ArsR family transcriptional regulator [Candidatus Thermoplasmatota archaeon]MCL5881245.1 ArsR family transcriptional regulator [Candidatus Thermoplasmatota archaeon]WMT44278.1 MAG: ArsR family transcriptional regulator [Cuniculiplasma divulgatum]